MKIFNSPWFALIALGLWVWLAWYSSQHQHGYTSSQRHGMDKLVAQYIPAKPVVLHKMTDKERSAAMIYLFSEK